MSSEGIVMKKQIQRDSKNQPFLEHEMENGEQIRVTLVGDSWSGENGIRIQIRQTDGHLRQGPEIPISCIVDVFKNIVNLSLENNDV